MMTKRIGLALAAGVLLGASTLAAADELATVEKKLQTVWARHKSISAKITVGERRVVGNQIADHTGTGTHEVLRKGDKILARVELKSRMSQEVAGHTSTVEQDVTIIVDGDVMYMLNTSMGQTVAVKLGADPQIIGEPRSTLADLRKKHDLTLLPEEMLDGRKVFVIQAGVRDDESTPYVKMILRFDQEWGVLLKSVSYGKGEHVLQTLTHSDLKFDLDIDPRRFVFEAPEGVRVFDQTTKQPNAPTRTDGATPTSQEASPPAP